MTGQRSLTVVTALVTVAATTLTNFNSFPTSKKIFAILFNKQVKQTKTTMGMLHKRLGITAQKMKFSIKDFFSKCDQIRSFLRIWQHLLKKYLMENFIFCALN